MNREIKCPKCGNQFTIDESSYNDIVSQIKNNAFNEEIERKIHEMYETKEVEHKLDLEKTKNQYESVERDLKEKIKELENKLDNTDTKLELEKNKVKLDYDAQIGDLKDQISKLQIEKEQEKIKNDEILKEKDSQISQLRDMKLKLSNKMVGEDLEQHCKIEFEKVRALFSKNTYFEKDNEVVEGSKGDFIFKETTDNGAELISIMFEMKNEMGNSTNRQTNESFFKKLDENRKKKNCEYAILVSTLEADNDYYNSGIVDVSYRYDKMYVIRPQCFIPIITILRNNALKNIDIKEELVLAQNKNIDITNFETKLSDFKDAISKNYDLAQKQFSNAIDEIDKTIAHLQKVRDNLTSSENNLRLANDKTDKLTIKKLTADSPLLKEAFKNNKKDSENN